MIGQEKHGHAALALILVEYLRVTAMEMMNALITLCVEIIIVLIPFRLMLTVALNLKSTYLFTDFLDVLQIIKLLCFMYYKH